MSVRKHKWTTKNGVVREGWLVDYVDLKGRRRAKSFRLKKQADRFAEQVASELAGGVHVPDRESVTVEAAAALWLASCERRELERSTRDAYQSHVDLHIVPFLGRVKLTSLTIATIKGFEDRLYEEGRSTDMIKRVVTSLGALIADAFVRGLIGRNVVKDLRASRNSSSERRAKKVKVGVDIPTPAEIKAILSAAADGYPKTFLMVAIFTGMRSSELRGLHWSEVDFKAGTVSVTQRADRYGTLGPPKTSAGERTIPVPPHVVQVLREWRLACPQALVFPTRTGGIADHTNLITRLWIPVQLAAGVTRPVLDANSTPRRDDDGRPVVKAKYTGLHALRHFNASWLINRKRDGGLELPAKVVQTRLGHASIRLTLDVYGHLFPVADDHAAELAAAADFLLS
jgi:integrase